MSADAKLFWFEFDLDGRSLTGRRCCPPQALSNSLSDN